MWATSRRSTAADASAALSVEDRVLLAAARPGSLGRRPAAPIDWSRLIDDAERHGLSAVLHRLADGLAGPVPSPARSALARRAHACVAWNLRLRHELVRVLRILDRAGISIMPLKGPVLADRLYAEPLLRPAADLDILVRRRELAAAGEALSHAGYIRVPAPRQGAGYHVVYTVEDRRAGDVTLELHWDLGERHVSGLDVDAVWASAAPARWEDCGIWTMSLRDLLLYLCVHAAKDGLASLKSLLDITLLIEQERERIPWAVLARTAIDRGIRRPVYLALWQSRDLLGACVPGDFLAAIRPRGVSWHIGSALFAWRGSVLHVRPERLVGSFMAILMLLWEDSWARRLRHLRRNLVPAPELRARWTSLPANASVLRWYPAWMWQIARTLIGRS